MRVLIVKIGAVGDVIMAMSMLEPLYRKDPNARITWVCGKAVEPLLRATGRVQELIPVDEARLLKGSAPQKILALLSVWVRLLGRHFDLVLTGHSDPRYRWLGLACRAGERRSFKPVEEKAFPVPGRYHGHEYARLARGGEAPYEPAGNGLVLQPHLPAEIQAALTKAGGPLVALAPGGARNVMRDDALRRWPLDHYVRLASSLIGEGMSVVLTGAPSDEWARKPFEGLPVIDLVGKTSLTDLAALYGACRLLITHDSGPLHLAILAGTPTLSLFGPTRPEEKVPSNPKNRVIWGGEQLACRPCYDGKNYAVCSSNDCLKTVTPEMVLGEALGMIGKI